MPANPIGVVIKGTTISEVYGFRYGQQLQDQQFFELKFKQPLLGSRFSFGTDDAASYADQPITLYLKGALGKLRSVSGTIVKLEFIQPPGQQAEVVVTGTMYSPSGNSSKFSLLLAALLIAPLLFAGGIFWRVSHVGNSLVKTEGTVRSFEGRSGRGSHSYTFKIDPYHASFYRWYHAPLFNTPRENIDDLFKDDGGYDASHTGQRAVYYIAPDDRAKLSNPAERIDFYYMRPPAKPFSNFDFYYDILLDISNKAWFYVSWISYVALEVFLYVCASFCYKMYALDQQGKNRIAWWACTVVALIFNLILLCIML